MSDNSRSDSVLDRAFPHSGPEPAAAILPAIWLDHVGINNLSRLRQVIESGDTRLASQVTIDLVKVGVNFFNKFEATSIKSFFEVNFGPLFIRLEVAL